MALASKWADNPQLVEAAQLQDTHKKTVTVKKGQALVSKWADAVEPETTADKPQPIIDNEAEQRMKAIRERQLAKKKAAEEEKRVSEEVERAKSEPAKEENALLKRLNELSIKTAPPTRHETPVRGPTSPKKSSKSKKTHRRPSTEPQWRDDVRHDDEDDRIKPTKAAQDFASRIGISLGSPEATSKKSKEDFRRERDLERQRNREKKVSRGTEWDSGKPGSKVDYSHKDKHATEPKKKVSEADRVSSQKAAQKELDDLIEKVNTAGTINWADLDDDF